MQGLIIKFGDKVYDLTKKIPDNVIAALIKGTAKLKRVNKAGREFAASRQQIANVINRFGPEKLSRVVKKVTPKKPVKKTPAKKQDAPASEAAPKQTKAAKEKARKAAIRERKAANKKRAEEKAEKLRNQRAEAQKKREAKERKAKEAADKRAAREAAEVEAGTTVIVKGAKKSPHSTREATKPKGTPTQVRRPAGSKDSAGKSRGGQFPKKGEPGAPDSKTRKGAAAAVKAKIDRTGTGVAIGTLGTAGVVGALLSDKDEDKKKGKKKTVVTTSPDNVGPLRPDRITPKDKPPITNKELGAHYNRINTLIEAENKGAGTYGIKYEGKEYRNWKEYNKAWEKENKGRDKPEGPLKKLFKGDKKKGGGRVSSRPKSYRTAKIMKQYAKGGSVRKPNRI